MSMSAPQHENGRKSEARPAGAPPNPVDPQAKSAKIALAVEGHLPFCPEGIDPETSQEPCRKKPTRRKRRGTFRVPLKKEDGNFEGQIIEYNCDFPNRVVVRLEYLMQSTKVRLNDKQWMDDFYEKLLEEETRALKKQTKTREKAELNRMKKLIIEGIYKDIPDELSYLHRHPVFRVNQMLHRLSRFEHGLYASTITDEITPVEPYEYDGNQFFRNLHETGTLWVPSEQEFADKEKLRGKIYRAKLRLLHKRELKATEEKVLRYLNNPEAHLQAEEDDIAGDTDDFGDSESNMGGVQKRQTFVSKLHGKSQATLSRLEDKIRQSKESELAREAQLDKKRREQESLFVGPPNYDTLSIISEYEKRQRRRTIDEILEQDKEEALGPGTDELQLRGKMKPFEKVFRGRSTDPLQEQTTFDQSTFKKLRNAYKAPGNFSYQQYEQYNNELISDYVDQAQDCDELFENGDMVSQMYDRQFLKMTDHLKESKPMK